MAEKDSLRQRIRDGLLLDSYGERLTEKQRLACEMILMQDFSLAEAAESLGVSRQAVHDLITRAREHMESCEKTFGLVANRRKRDEIERLLEENRARLPEDFYGAVKKILDEQVTGNV